MGTRNLICVVYNGRFVLAQRSSFDGYPEGQGAAVVKFLQYSGNIQRLKDGLEHTYEVSESAAIAARNQIDALRGLERVAWQAFLQFRSPELMWEILDYLTPSLPIDRRRHS